MSLFSFGPDLKRALPYTDKVWPGAVIFSIFAGVALCYGGWSMWENHRFADHAQQVEARVLHKYIVTSQGKHGPVYTPHLTYGYQAGNVIINSDAVVQRDTWNQVAEGGSMPVLYLPEQPVDNRIENTAEEFRPIISARFGLCVGLFFLVVDILVTVSVSRRKKLVEKIRSSGLRAHSHVTAVDSERIGKQRKSFLRFEFTDNRGHTILGRSLPLTSRQARLWTMGQSITVYYDPLDSRVFTVNLDARR